MKDFFVLFAGVILLASVASGQTRPRFTEEKLKQIDVNLVHSLESNIPGIVNSALKTVRDVKALAPEYSFSHSMTIALMRFVKDEHASHQTRILAAFALDDMDSELGNYAIKMQAKFTESECLKRVCTLLAYNRAVERQRGSSVQPMEQITASTK